MEAARHPLVHYSLEQRTKRELLSSGEFFGCALNKNKTHASLVQELAKCLMVNRTVHVLKCSPGEKVPPRDLSDLEEIMSLIRWPKSSGKATRRVSTAGEASNFVLGSTKGPAGSNGFHHTIRTRKGGSHGINKDIVPHTLQRQKELLLALWKIGKKIVRRVDPDFRFSSMQVNKNFSGMPHVDKTDVTYQYALSFGDFVGGRLVVSTDDPTKFISVDTKGRLTRCDGRHPHWVTSFKGTRFSLIFYRIHGRHSPRESNLPQHASCQKSSVNDALPRMKKLMKV